jgi:hypothetical protein
MPALRTLAFAGGAIVLALTAVIFFLQTREGSDGPEGQETAEDDAILGAFAWPGGLVFGRRKVSGKRPSRLQRAASTRCCHGG